MKLFAVLGAAAALGGFAPAAQAMPAAPPAPAPALVQQAAYGCGFGWHPNYWGRCVPNARVYYRPVPVYGYGYYYHPRPRYWGHPYWHHRWGY